MHYFIDGYNFLFRLSTKKLPLQKKRETVLRLLNKQITELKLDITVVFDSAQTKEEQGLRGHFESLEIVYTDKAQSADDYIFEMITLSSHPSNETVITSDRELSSRCKALGARTQSIEAFISWVGKKREKKKRLSSTNSQKGFKDSEANLARLMLIFEKRLMEDVEKEKP